MKLSGQPVIFVSGIVQPDDSAELSHVYVLEERPEQYPSGTVGEYSLTLLDAGDTTIMQVDFDLEFRVSTYVGWIETEADGFAFTLPYPPEQQGNIARVQLSHLGSVIAERVVSSNAPTVQVSSPTGGENLVIGEDCPIGWSGNDADADDLRYTVLYSPDDGENWAVVALECEETQYVWSDSYLRPSGTCRVRVIANDGFHTTMDDSDGVFSLSALAPTVIEESSRRLGVMPLPESDPVALLVTGDADDPAVSYLSAYVQADGTLGADPVFQNPVEWGTVHVRGEEIRPGTSYLVQADLGAPGDPALSIAASATTWDQGEVINNGTVNVFDIFCILDAIAGTYDECTPEGNSSPVCSGSIG